MKPLNLKETSLKEEMKERCLAKGQYKDEKAKDKFKMLCHLEDFEVQCWELQEENEQLKDNWNDLKKYAKEIISTDNELYGTDLLDKMQELEKGDNNE